MFLMAGMNTSFIASQLGHTEKVLLSTYAQWIPTDADWDQVNKLYCPKSAP
jgi:integrase